MVLLPGSFDLALTTFEKERSSDLLDTRLLLGLRSDRPASPVLAAGALELDESSLVRVSRRALSLVLSSAASLLNFKT